MTPDYKTIDGDAELRLEEIIRDSISCTIREAGNRLRRGTRYTRKIAERLETRRAISISRYKQVRDWRLSLVPKANQ